jgi:hypothetical protein
VSSASLTDAISVNAERYKAIARNSEVLAKIDKIIIAITNGTQVIPRHYILDLPPWRARDMMQIIEKCGLTVPGLTVELVRTAAKLVGGAGDLRTVFK